MHALGNENPAGTKSIREQLVGPAINYEVHRCRMVIFHCLDSNAIVNVMLLDYNKNEKNTLIQCYLYCRCLSQCKYRVLGGVMLLI
jgi:peptidyl-tRNA hydrolase